MPIIGRERVKRLREEHGRGTSIMSLARREHINPNTLRRALRGESYRDEVGTYWLTVGLPHELVDRLRETAAKRSSMLDVLVRDALVAFLQMEAG